jgi:hypothetical protein
MWGGPFGKIAMAVLAVLLAFNLLASFGLRAAGKPEADTKIVYSVVRVDPSTNEDNLFRQAGEKRWQFAGTIEVGGSTGYLIFRK